MKKNVIRVMLAAALVIASGCSSGRQFTVKDQIAADNIVFLKEDPKAAEVFHILMSSDSYVISQMKGHASIRRVPDPGGDKYMSEELKRYDKIDEAREGVVSIWLYPDSGRLMKVRPKKPIYLTEIDNLLIEDMQRWNYEFPRKTVEPTSFDVKYRVVLQKKQSDDEIMKEVREKIKEKRIER
jgi:hypothetical protein